MMETMTAETIVMKMNVQVNKIKFDIVCSISILFIIKYMAGVRNLMNMVICKHNGGLMLELKGEGGYCTPNQKLACFVLYLKIINTFLKTINICILQ